jgi:hypothetical protein
VKDGAAGCEAPAEFTAFLFNTGGGIMVQRLITGAILLAALASASPAAAYRQIATGDFVVTWRQAPLKDGSRTMLTVPRGTELTVGDVRGRWLLVGVPSGDRTVRGWIHAQNLRIRPDCAQSSITFDNQSGESAVVRLVGPSRREIFVPDGQQATLSGTRAGHYRLYARYRTDDGDYRYVAGDHFDVEASANTYSRITITLHGVIHGNYGSWPSSKAEFDQAAP